MFHYSPIFEIAVTCFCLIRYCSRVFDLVNDEACCCDFSGFWWLINLMVQRQSDDLQPPWRWFLVNLGHLTIKLKWYIDTFTKLSDNFMSKFFNFVVKDWQGPQPISYKANFSQKEGMHLIDAKINTTYQNNQGEIQVRPHLKP